MAWKRLASCGSCFTMSPPERTMHQERGREGGGSLFLVVSEVQQARPACSCRGCVQAFPLSAHAPAPPAPAAVFQTLGGSQLPSHPPPPVQQPCSPEKTASMYIHMFCTMSHCSSTSPTTDRRPIQPVTCSRNGALYLWRGTGGGGHKERQV